MAKAPSPGKIERAQAEGLIDAAPLADGERPEEKPRYLRLTVGGLTKVIDWASLGPGDDLVSRQQCGIPVSALLGIDQFGGDLLLILWWTARRLNGEPRLTFATVLGEFPTNADLDAAIDTDAAAWLTEAEMVELRASDPE